LALSSAKCGIQYRLTYHYTMCL